MCKRVSVSTTRRLPTPGGRTVSSKTSTKVYTETRHSLSRTVGSSTLGTVSLLRRRSNLGLGRGDHARRPFIETVSLFRWVPLTTEGRLGVALRINITVRTLCLQKLGCRRSLGPYTRLGKNRSHTLWGEPIRIPIVPLP